MFPLYNADGYHGTLEETRYPKAGDPNPDVKLGFVQATGGATVWADFNSAADHQLGWPEWKPDGSALYVQWQNRGQDTLRMFAVNPADASKTAVYFETQKTWISLDEADDRLTFINNGADMVIMSDKTGWKQLYLYGSDGTFKNNITSGNFYVQEVMGLDEKNKVLYIRARGKENSARTDVYAATLDGKKLTRLTFGEYNHSRFSFSPNYKYMVTSYSNVSTPGGMAIVDNKGKKVHDLGTMAAPGLANYALAKTELIRIKSADGKYDLPCLITWPTNYDANKKYPMLVNVYGGPDATQVMDGWNWNAQRQWYAQEGLLQVTFDNRASGHFGKAGINEIHRQLGIPEIEDFKTMAKYFTEKGIADPTKVCMTGFSYGGYMTCMALTYAADVFTHGMAGGSVTDWHLYDSHYTERYMDLPSENEEGYKKTSVMPYVDRYKGMLQIVHGTMDDNVHMQNSMQLIGALQDKGKDFELMFYPNGRHGWGFLPARNNHFTNLKTKFIYKYLLEKEVPKEILR
jgi:dipeptidyl-peptidase-4